MKNVRDIARLEMVEKMAKDQNHPNRGDRGERLLFAVAFSRIGDTCTQGFFSHHQGNRTYRTFSRSNSDTIETTIYNSTQSYP